MTGGKVSRQLAARILEKLGLTADTVKEIETISYHDLAQAANAARAEMSAAMGCRIGFHPIADGSYYLGDPFDVGFREETKHIPLMIGSVIAEFMPSVEDAKPGDVIFFEGTMGEDTGGITHCGLYVGNNMMIHCGNPCSYADLTDSYWQQ